MMNILLSLKESVKRLATALCVIVCVLGVSAAHAQEKKSFKVAWSIYSGWMPWAYATDKGIIKKWADKYDIEIEVVQMNDYIESINQFTAGEFDACAMTNMDALTIPAAFGVDTTGLILGDYSNGNDGIVLKNGDSMADIKGRNVNLVELSVSHYFLARALDMNGMSERDVTVINTSDADAVSSYMTDDVTAVAVWNPQLGIILDSAEDATEVFTSKQIPGEIIDMMAAKTEVLEANPAFGKALVGAWFETLSLMQGDSAEAIAARTYMAEQAGTDLAGYEAQLADTMLFYTPEDAYKFASSKEIMSFMDMVREFSFDKGLLGEGSPSPDVVGMEFADGSVLGDKSNIQLRFDASYVKMAVDGEL
ncbi:putative urea ABC transporter substrate-binding protein [Gilvimarinus agarilyticus]|uniref:putative urea ABC transporter substrate-binding protein n=1 Tax=Gilvimarinus sp. 2_MG-2023 TaxID=3062666 RepID=UPI001C093133|nr:putative urea ABC transporter substrate-binding protein [Gilvimarinus sp. 2_MG-2023]MBU2884587.1 putative urea ABC transporter substrate-binding protein [Gilvimarinus agarilyticus]MDO6569696.1 putative urea ABC transporter substrate-binding protein [Gilvimarinus sp. 2_MG-2023]